MGLFIWFLLEVCLAGVVINVNPGGSVLVSCGDLNDPCASLSAAFASTTMGEGATIKIADNAVLLGPDNVNCVVAFKSVVISGGVGSTIDGGGQIVVSVSADLLRTEGPTFVSLNFVNATIALGISSGSVQLSRFQGSGGRCGIVYAGERPSGSQQIDLSVLETSFEGSCGINVNSGVLSLVSVSFTGNLASVFPAISLAGVVQFTSNMVQVVKWSGSVVDSSAEGTFTWNSGKITSCFDHHLMDFRGQGSSVSIIGLESFFNSGSVRILNGTTLLVDSCVFISGMFSPYLMLGDGIANIKNCSFVGHSSSACINCGLSSGSAGLVDVAVTDCSFVSNLNSVLASVATVSQGCVFSMSLQSKLEDNSAPQIDCNGGNLTLDKSWNSFVQCSSCNWGGCSVPTENNTVQIVLLVFGCLALTAFLIFGGIWFWRTYRNRFAKRLQYENIQDNGFSDDL